MSIKKSESDEFEVAVTNVFSFLEHDFNFSYIGSKTIQEDPRDSYVVAKYRRNNSRINIAWNPFAMSIIVLIRLNNDELGRREKYIYFEPFVEFSSNGSLTPVVPQIYPGMSIGKIEKAMEQRKKCFDAGIVSVVEVLAKRLREYYSTVESASADTINQYHKWYLSKGENNNITLGIT